MPNCIGFTHVNLFLGGRNIGKNMRYSDYININLQDFVHHSRCFKNAAVNIHQFAGFLLASLSLQSQSPRLKMGMLILAVAVSIGPFQTHESFRENNMIFLQNFMSIKTWLGRGFTYFLCSSLPGEMIQFDSYFSNGLKPPTRWGGIFLCFLMSNTDHCNIKNPEGGLFELTKIHLFTGSPHSKCSATKQDMCIFWGTFRKKNPSSTYLIRTIIVGNSQHFVCSFQSFFVVFWGSFGSNSPTQDSRQRKV